MLNIAMISQYQPGGSKIGSGYQAHYMANALCRRGHRVTMFSLCEPGDGALYETVIVPTQRPRTFRFAWNLRKIDWSRFDVLHAHGDDYWLWSHQGKPIHVRTMHGSCFAEAIHIPRLFDKLRMTLLGLSEVAATIVADRTVCVSRNTTAYYPWVKDVIVNGVDLAAFHPQAVAGDSLIGEAPSPLNGKEAQPTILFVGTWYHRKRGAMLAEAFARTIRPALPDAQLWMVCGDAPPAGGVTVFGRVSLEKLAELYRRAWVFCLPSSYEGFGVPYIEAMASGTPVVATPNVGAREVLDEGRYGLLVDDEKLGVAIRDLLQNPAERDRLRSLGLARAREYSWDLVVDRYDALYETLAQKGQRPRGSELLRSPG